MYTAMRIDKSLVCILILFVVGVFLIFFLSWKTDPHLKEFALIPEWLANWTDDDQNNQIRTGILF